MSTFFAYLDFHLKCYFPTYFSKLLDVTSSCGHRIASAKDAQNSENIYKRILGGKEAKKHDWPWQAYIR